MWDQGLLSESVKMEEKAEACLEIAQKLRKRVKDKDPRLESRDPNP